MASSSSSSSRHASPPPSKRQRGIDIEQIDVCNIAPLISDGVREMKRIIDSAQYRDAAAHSSSVSSHVDPRSLSVVVARAGICIELIMQHMHTRDIMALAQTSRSMLLIAAHGPLVWTHAESHVISIINRRDAAQVLSSYHPVLMSKFPVTFIPDATPELYAATNRIIDIIQSMRVTTLVLSQRAITWLRTDPHASRILLVLWSLVAFIVHNDRYSSDSINHIDDIIVRSPRIAHVILDSHDHAIPLTLANALRNKAGIRSLKFDATRCIRDIQHAFFIMSSLRLQQSLTHLCIGAQWDSDGTAYLVAELHRFEQLRELYLTRTAQHPWPGAHPILGSIAATLPASLTRVTCEVYYCACTKGRSALIAKVHMATAARNIRRIALQGNNLSVLCVKLIGCYYTINQAGNKQMIEDVMRAKIGVIAPTRVVFTLEILGHGDVASNMLAWSDETA